MKNTDDARWAGRDAKADRRSFSAPGAIRVEQLGLDEVLLVSPTAALEEIERVRDFL